MPKPVAFCPFLCFVKNDDDIGIVIERLRLLRLDGTLPSTVHIGNDLRALSSVMSFPKDRVSQEETYLAKALRHELRAEAGIGAWVISGALYGNHAQVRSSRRLLKKALSGIKNQLFFLPPWLLTVGDKVVGICERLNILPSIQNKLHAARSLANMHSGIPTAKFLKGSYWRRQGGVPDDFN